MEEKRGFIKNLKYKNTTVGLFIAGGALLLALCVRLAFGWYSWPEESDIINFAVVVAVSAAAETLLAFILKRYGDGTTWTHAVMPAAAFGFFVLMAAMHLVLFRF